MRHLHRRLRLGGKIKNRTYDWKGKLITWTQDRCSCGRFLSKHQQKLCFICAEKRHNSLSRKSHKEIQEQVFYYSMQSLHNLIGSIPHYLANNLRVYF